MIADVIAAVLGAVPTVPGGDTTIAAVGIAGCLLWLVVSWVRG